MDMRTDNSETTLLEELVSFSNDPLGYVTFAYPWGMKGSELEFEEGPNDFQRRVLEDIRLGLLTPEEAILLATTSGHGVGKSALVAWIIDWAQTTFEDCKGVVTANTENQLKTKTWAELAKWHRLSLSSQFFKMTATARFSVDPEHERTWRIDMVPWSERNTEAFAGLHNAGKRILLVFDEGSAIPDLIYEVAEGALTDENTQIIWAIFGNPTRSTGRFRECFAGGKFAHRWKSRKVDSRTIPQTNKDQLNRWIQDYGEDSDFVRVRVKGEFPRVDAESFISAELARSAVNREIIPQRGMPVVIGVDVGRFGDDPSVIYPRKGRDARSLPIEILPSADTMTVAKQAARAYTQYAADFVCVDSGGVGGGVVDRLRQLRVPVIEVDFGSAPTHSNLIETGVKYYNKRAEIWGAMRDWLSHGSIPERVAGNITAGNDLVTLIDELAGPKYGMRESRQGESIQLESKKDMRRRGVPSPNIADALACTFAAEAFVPDIDPRHMDRFETVPQVTGDYNPYELERI